MLPNLIGLLLKLNMKATNSDKNAFQIAMHKIPVCVKMISQLLGEKRGQNVK